MLRKMILGVRSQIKVFNSRQRRAAWLKAASHQTEQTRRDHRLLRESRTTKYHLFQRTQRRSCSRVEVLKITRVRRWSTILETKPLLLKMMKVILMVRLHRWNSKQRLSKMSQFMQSLRLNKILLVMIFVMSKNEESNKCINPILSCLPLCIRALPDWSE